MAHRMTRQQRAHRAQRAFLQQFLDRRRHVLASNIGRDFEHETPHRRVIGKIAADLAGIVDRKMFGEARIGGGLAIRRQPG